jgi:site-specific DNA-methyltransferase (adenine-specific)
MARKPLSEKSVAENVLKHGTGGINIDESRVETNEELGREQKDGPLPSKYGFNDNSMGNKFQEGSPLGRFPANVIHDGSEEVMQGFPETKSGRSNNNAEIGEPGNVTPLRRGTLISRDDDGSAGRFFKEIKQGRFPANVLHDGSEEVLQGFPHTKSGMMKQHIEGGQYNVYGKMYPRDVETIGDEGSAARFFYCAKVSRKERNKGLDSAADAHKSIGGNYSQSPVCKTCDKTLNGTNDHSSCSGEVYYRKMKSEITKNNHPTVKPIELMKYLCKLITPKGGTIFDPFMGSGSTGMAAKEEGFDFIGIEKEEDYYNIALQRINNQSPLKEFM